MITHKHIQQELARRSYADYVEYVHEGRYIHGKFTRYLCAEVQSFIEKVTGKSKDILILNVPPQHSKSMTITETLPSWYLGKNPEKRVIEISYNDDFAKRFIRRNKEKINAYGYELFDIQIGNPDTANEFALTNNIGSMLSRGIGSGVTGNPCDLMIIDDPIKTAGEAQSENTRESIFNEWLSSFVTRLSPGAKVILIMTRWHKEDLAGKLIKNEADVKLINFPVECLTETDLLGRKRGDPLFPEIKRDKAWLEDFKKSFLSKEGSRAWNALYLCNPTDEEGNIFKREWFRYYDVLPPIAIKVISVDATFKDMESAKGTPDFVAIQAWGKTNANFYLIERIKRMMGFVDTLLVLDDFIRRHHDYIMILVEDKANGSAIIDVMRRRYPGVIAIQTEGGKIARANAIAPLYEAGNVFIHQSHYEFENEHVDFPFGANDDEVDCASQALNKMRDAVAELPYQRDPDYHDYDDEVNDILDFR